MRTACVVPGCPELLEDDQACPRHLAAAQYVSHKSAAEMILGTMSRDEARQRLYDALVELGGGPPQPDERVGERLELIEDDDTYRWIDALLWAAIAPPERYGQQNKLGGPGHYHLDCLITPPCDFCSAVDPPAAPGRDRQKREG